MLSQFARLPLIGRDGELRLIHSLLDDAAAGRGGTLILHGASGVGKSRLLRNASDQASQRGWTSAFGRAYPVVSGIPYAPFTDAFLPLLRRSPDTSPDSPGGNSEISYLFPMLHSLENSSGRAAGEPAELRTRLLFNVTEFLSRIASHQPLLLVLDDLQWADASSLELLHFIARQATGGRIALLCAYNDALLDQNPQLRAVEQSLATHDGVHSRAVPPLTHAETAELIARLFGMQEVGSAEFTALLYGWTRGNPFFLEELLKSMVESGKLQRNDGVWRGWESAEIALPSSIREAVMPRLSSLSPAARELADLMAAIGTNIAHASLGPLVRWSEDAVVDAIDELLRLRVLEERTSGREVVYDFTHPVLRETLYAGLSLARARSLHGRIAEALEEGYGTECARHADELAYHFARSRSERHAEKAVRYLYAAGRRALETYSNREAADYLGAAVERAAEIPATLVPPSLLEDLARARQRLGDFDSAFELLVRTREAALAAGDAAGVASAERRLGLVRYRAGRLSEALEHYAAGLEWAGRAGDQGLYARLKLAQGDSLLELGRASEALRCVEAALPIAEGLGDPGLIARVQLALLLLHTWAGEPQRARAYGERTLALAEDMNDASLSCTVHWALAVLAGFTGDAAATGRHSAACARLADELQSPLHRLRAAELAVEYSASTGEWTTGIAVGERAIESARALRQHALLARLLVWTALIHMGRGDYERAKRFVDEAWSVSNAGGPASSVDVHAVVPAHYGRAAYHLTVGDFAAAVQVGEAGLAIAARAGYTVWGIHRLLPIIGEAYLSMGDIDGAAVIGARLRGDSERLGHPLGVAWADACDGFLMWLRGDTVGCIERIRTAAERLEAISIIPDAARLRRHLAARLRDNGERDAALRELRHLHEVFSRLGAERELSKTREQIRELGGRPPAREAASGLAGLSAREMEIGRLVAARRTNKAIARQLAISPRTVGTHLTNMFRKLHVDSRAALADALRRMDHRE